MVEIKSPVLHFRAIMIITLDEVLLAVLIGAAIVTSLVSVQLAN